ncbi:hypothetical protein A6R68_07044 [Neotoma lepida]|uniref:HSR domain-containing protein n=1 Tax=Neotoma lepida TaxID=56216 RepID=A0A1A6GEY3_NEOLE|nr:hypothetical protein A6R68_07044 [Neotoma lepida]
MSCTLQGGQGKSHLPTRSFIMSNPQRSAPPGEEGHQRGGVCSQRLLRLVSAIQKKESFNEIFVNYFKENKIEIAHAIPKLFPFLESLKDRSFITDRFYAVINRMLPNSKRREGTNPDTHENRTQPCFVKQKNPQKPGTMQNQEDEVIVISSDGSEGSDEDDEKELLEVFTLTPRVGRQMEEERPESVFGPAGEADVS